MKIMNKTFLLISRCVGVLFILFYKAGRQWNRIANFVTSSVISTLISTKGRFNVIRPVNISGFKYITAHSVTAGSNLRIEVINKYESQQFMPDLHIGENVSFNVNCHVGVINRVAIGNNVLIGSNVLITDHSHGTTDLVTLKQVHPQQRLLFSKGPVIIEDDVWIGENVCILPNVIIGKGSVIGCNTVVNKNVPPYSIVVGNPMRILHAR